MHISIYILVCENDIFIDIFNISFNFVISHNGYFHTNAMYIKFLNSFSLPDVASAIIALLHIISLVSLRVTVGEDNEPNNVEFVLIYIHCEITETFQ